jgi:hypothetical protein
MFYILSAFDIRKIEMNLENSATFLPAVRVKTLRSLAEILLARIGCRLGNIGDFGNLTLIPKEYHYGRWL